MTLTSHTDFAAFLEAVQQCRGGGTVLYPGRRQAESEIHPVQISVRRVSRERGTAEKGKNRVPVSTGRGKIDTHPFRLDVKANRE